MSTGDKRSRETKGAERHQVIALSLFQVQSKICGGFLALFSGGMKLMKAGSEELGIPL